MNQSLPKDTRDPAFQETVAQAQARIGRAALNDEDLTVLAVEAISRTYTREEKRYDA